MVRFSVKNLDGVWRSTNYTLRSKVDENKDAKELVEMFKHFLYNGNILGYTVVIVTYHGNEKHIEVIGTEV